MYVKNTPLKLGKEKSEVGDLFIYWNWIENLEKVLLVQIDRLNEKSGQLFSRKTRFFFAAVPHIRGGVKTLSRHTSLLF